MASPFTFPPSPRAFYALRAMRVFALCVLQFTALAAHATCMFARDTKPQDWYQWAEVLVAGDVAGIEPHGSVDVVSLRIAETFKGPGGVQTATLEIPQKLWTTCRIERPAPGDHVLGALAAQAQRRLENPFAAFVSDARLSCHRRSLPGGVAVLAFGAPGARPQE